MFLDEYKRREDFDEQMKAAHDDPELAKVINDESFPRWNPLIVLKSRKSQVWTEVEELRVEFR